MAPLFAKATRLIVAPAWAPVRRAPVRYDTVVMTLPALWRALDAHSLHAAKRLLPLAVEWHVDAALMQLEAPLQDAVGALRLASSAVTLLRASGIDAATLSSMARAQGVGADVCTLLSTVERVLGDTSTQRHQRTDATDATRAALRVAQSATWPSPLQHVEHVEFRHGTEWLGRDLALALAIAKSNRTVTVEADGDAHAHASPSAMMALPYEDAMLAPLEASGAATLNVSFIGSDGEEPQAHVDIKEVPPGIEAIERVAFDVGQCIGRGMRPEHIAIALPPSAPPLWRRRAATRRLRALLDAAGIPHQGGPVARFQDTTLGLLCLDALTLAHAIKVSPSQTQPALPLGAWGRVLFSLGELPHAPSLWPLPSLDERVDVNGLRRRLFEQVGLDPEQARIVVDAAQHVIDAYIRALLVQPVTDGFVHLLAIAERMQQVVDAPKSDWAAQMAVLQETLVELEAAYAQGPKDAHPLALQLLFVRRAIERAPLKTAGANGGVVLLRPEDLLGARFDAVFVVGANEQVWFRPPSPNPFLPEALVRALARKGLAVLTPAASVAGERPLLPRDRAAWLWHNAYRAAKRQFHAYLLLEESGDDKNEPGCEALTKGKPIFALASPVVTESTDAQLTAAHRLRAQAAHGPRQTASRRAALSAHTGEALEAAIFAREQRAGDLDELARCRFRYFAGHLLSLKERERPTPTPSPQLLGKAMHAALKDAVEQEAKRRAKTGMALPLGEVELEKALQQAEVDFFLHDAEQYLPPGSVHPHLLGATRAHVWAATRAQLVSAWQTEDLVARHCEIGFGGRYSLPALVLQEPQGARRLRVKGAIDRVDVFSDSAMTLDYKSSWQKRIEHRHLQLPLYMLVVGRSIAPAHVLKAGWLALMGNQANKLQRAKHLEGDWTTLHQRINHDAWQRLRPLLQGDIRADPAPASSCRACSFGDICQMRQADDQEELDGDEAEVEV